MKYVFVIFSFIIFLSNTEISGAQETEKVTVRNKIPDSREVFHVIKGTAVRHGKYSRTLRGSMSVEEKGQYENGEKAGVWEFFGPTGAVEQKYDFSENELLFDKHSPKPFTGITQSAIIVDGALKKNTTGKLPILLGGMSKYQYYLVNHLQYPQGARAAQVEGTIIISVTITKEGQITDEKIEGEAGYGLGEESLRVVKLLPDEWIPLYIDGEPVDTRIFIPIRFQLS